MSKPEDCSVDITIDNSTLSTRGPKIEQRYNARMPSYRNGVPQGPSWFDWLPFRTQYLLLLLLCVPLTVGFFLGGMHCVHTGHPVSLANSEMDASEFFFGSAFCFFLSGCLVAGLFGWIKPSKPHISETHHREPSEIQMKRRVDKDN